MAGFADDLKKQLLIQTQQLLFNAAKGVGADMNKLGEEIATLFQNDLENVPLEDIEAAKARVEQVLSGALDTFSDVLRVGADLKQGKLPS